MHTKLFLKELSWPVLLIWRDQPFFRHLYLVTLITGLLSIWLLLYWCTDCEIMILLLIQKHFWQSNIFKTKPDYAKNNPFKKEFSKLLFSLVVLVNMWQFKTLRFDWTHQFLVMSHNFLVLDRPDPIFTGAYKHLKRVRCARLRSHMEHYARWLQLCPIAWWYVFQVLV